MTRQEISLVISKLESAKEIIFAAGETEFEELGRRKKEQIFDLFNDDFDCEADGDSDGTSRAFKFDAIEICFFSAGQDWDDFEKYMNSMQIEYNSYQFESTIQELDKAIVYLKSLSPEVVGVLNTSILTTPGDYSLKTISLEQAKEIAQSCDLDSAVGHASTAQIISTLLGVDVPLNRQLFEQKVGQRSLVFKLRGRPDEGKILSAKEIGKIGYDFQLLIRKS